MIHRVLSHIVARMYWTFDVPYMEKADIGIWQALPFM